MINPQSRLRALVALAFTGIVLVPLFPLPQPVSMSGHPWKVEFIFFSAVTVLLTFLLIKGRQLNVSADLASPRIFLTLFLVWSAASVLWAAFPWSVFHHTIVWTGYLIVFLLTSSLLLERRGARLVVESLAILALILSLLIAFAYTQLLVSPAYEGVFRVTYSKYSEILVALVPLFFGIVMLGRERIPKVAAVCALAGFAAIIMSLSRTSFIAAAAGITAAFLGSLWFAYDRSRALKRGATMAVALILIAITAQFAAGGKQSDSTLYGRFSSDKEYQTSSGDIRRLLVGVSLEMARAHPVLGVGADNFGTEIITYRSAFAQSYPDHPALSAGEELLLERAHNEYLQILAELGIPGFVLFAFFLASGGLSTSQAAKDPADEIGTIAADRRVCRNFGLFSQLARKFLFFSGDAVGDDFYRAVRARRSTLWTQRREAQGARVSNTFAGDRPFGNRRRCVCTTRCFGILCTRRRENGEDRRFGTALPDRAVL